MQLFKPLAPPLGHAHQLQHVPCNFRPAPSLARSPPRSGGPACGNSPCADRSLNDISLEYTYDELAKATGSFEESVKLGSGSYGGVYKGTLKDGTEVAVKVLEVPNEAGFEEEVKVLSKFRHPNLVILMGFARHGFQRLLVYEMLAGGDVHRRLQRSCHEDAPFSWQQRVGVALDAACGLSHLHHSSPKVFHRDIKSPNILLDKNGTAKMADFGLACLSHTAAHRVARASGTVGYACPLYVRRGVVTEGSEVYSFGMVLFELLTSSPPAYMSRKGGEGQIQYLAHQINGDLGCALKLVDRKALWPPASAQSFAELALACTQMREEARPSFAEIVRVLRAMAEGPQAAAKPDGAQVRAASSSQERRSRDPAASARRAASPCPRVHPCFGASPRPGVLPQWPQQQQQQWQHQQQHQWQQQQQQQLLQQQQQLQQQQEQQQQQQEHQGQKQPELELFALECIRAQGVDCQMLAPERRRIVHGLSREAGNVPRALEKKGPLQVGRAFQTPLFEELVAKSVSGRSTISREHFQVWVDASQGRGACNFILQNCSGNGTRLNDQLLQGRGEQAPLHHGDLVTLTRFGPGAGKAEQADFIQFRFDLSRSCLEGYRGSPTPGGPDGDVAGLSASHSSRSRGRSSRRSSRPEGVKVVRSAPASSPEGDPALVLEVMGPGVKMQLPEDARRLAFVPPAQSKEPFSSFVIGRQHQLDFWPEVLHPDALSTLSRQHVEVQTWCAQGGRFSFVARNLSEINPVHVIANLEGTALEQPRALAKGEQRHLLHGDRLVMNLGQAHTFWMTFSDLTGRHESQSRQVRGKSAAKDEDLISTAATPHQDEDEDGGRFLLKAGSPMNLPGMQTLKVDALWSRPGSISPGPRNGDGQLRSSRSSASCASTLQAKGYAGMASPIFSPAERLRQRPEADGLSRWPHIL